MLSLVTCALALNVAVKPVSTAMRAPAPSLLMNGDSKTFGKLPESVSMAGACPVLVGPNGKEAGYSGSSAPVRAGSCSGFVYESAVPLSAALGMSFKEGVEGRVVPTKNAMVMPMNFN